MTNKRISELLTGAPLSGDEYLAIVQGGQTVKVTIDQFVARQDANIVETSNDIAAVALSINNVDNTSDATKNSATATLTNKTINLANNSVTGTLAQINDMVSDANLVSLIGVEQLTNKTINLANNSVTGTLAELNSAVSDANLVSLTGSEILTNKTIVVANNTITTATSGNLTSTNLNSALAELQTDIDSRQPAIGALTGLLKSSGGNIATASAADIVTAIGASSVQNATTAANATGIADGVVSSAAKVANGILTWGKMVAISTGKLLGRTTAGSGQAEEISIGTGLAMASNVLSCTVTAPVLSVGTYTGAVTNAQVAAAASAGYGYTPANGANYAPKDSYGAVGQIAVARAFASTTNTGGATNTGVQIFGPGGSGTWRLLLAPGTNFVDGSEQAFQRIA